VVGFAYAIDGKPVSVRTFAHPRLLKQHFEGFVKAFCLEADLAQRVALGAGKTVPTAPGKSADLVTLVKELRAAKAKARDGLTGGGTYQGGGGGPYPLAAVVRTQRCRRVAQGHRVLTPR
jgi:hypothetical protein